MAISNKKKTAGVASLVIGTLALVGAGTSASFSTQSEAAQVGFSTGVMNKGLVLTGDNTWTNDTTTGNLTKSLGTNKGSWVGTADTLKLTNDSTFDLNPTLRLDHTGLADKMKFDVKIKPAGAHPDDYQAWVPGQKAPITVAPGASYDVWVESSGSFDNADLGKSGSYTVSVDAFA